MRFAPLFLAALCALVLFSGLGRVGFMDWREARGALVARELVTRREALTPLLNTQPWFEKPMASYALDVLAEWRHPGSPSTSRILRAIAAIALLLLTASIGAQHLGARAGWIAAGVLGSSIAFPLAARTDGTQVLATLFGWAGCAGFADALFGRRGGREARLLVAYGGLAAALLCGGLLPALWPFAGAALRSDGNYPNRLNKIINLFETLPEDERRETLVSYADNAKKQEPREGEKFDLVDVRKDEECMDTVGVYLHVDEHGKAHIRMTLGPEVQTLTRSMTAILCKGLEGSTPQEILDLPSDFVTRIVGTELVRIRSQTIYYVLTRIKSICKVYLDRQRMAQVA